MNARTNISDATRARLVDRLCRAGFGPAPALEVVTANLRAAKGMAATIGVIAGRAETLEDLDPADLSAVAWALADQIESALILLDGMAESAAANLSNGTTAGRETAP